MNRTVAVAAVAALAEPTRRRLYEYVVDQPGPVGRDDAAEATGVTRALAAFHLDRLVRSGLLTSEYHRRGERRGPGAGRPAKFYRRAAGTLEVSLPARRYAVAADLFAAALEREGGSIPPEALLQAARTFGLELGSQALAADRQAPVRATRPEVLLAALRQAGYEPEVADGGAGLIRLRNCPFDRLATTHQGLTCAMNLAVLEGLLAGVEATGLLAERVVAPGYCCVAFRPTGPAGATPSSSPGRP